MPNTYYLAVIALVLSVCAVGCAGLRLAPERPRVAAQKAATAAEDKQRQMLNEGYSMLYTDASHLDLAGFVLYVKVESDAVDELVTAIAKFGGELKKELERIARDYPGVRIDLDPLPEMEKRKRSAIGKDRASYFAPLMGHGGREYERTVLIGLLNGINHESHLCQVMAQAETDAGLKKFLIATNKRYDALYGRTMKLLDQEYFSDPVGASAN